MKPAAAVDMGSNTVRLLIADPDHSANLNTIRLERRVTRLSRNLVPGGPLDERAKARTLDALEHFGRLAAGAGVERVFGGATAAVRLARDGDDFLALVRERTGLDIRKLPGGEEARLTALGMLSGLPSPRPERVLAVDPGGQSTEFIPVEGGRVGRGVSLNIGVVGLTERFLAADPPKPGEMEALTREVDRAVARVREMFPPAPGLKLIGTAGTVTTIAAMMIGMREYDPGRVTGLALTEKKVDRMLADLLALPMAQRVGMPGLEAGREDVIIPGLVMVHRLIKGYGLDEMSVVDAGLLEGLIINGLGL